MPAPHSASTSQLSGAHRGESTTECPVAERLNREALSLPCSVGLSESEQARVIEAIRERMPKRV